MVNIFLKNVHVINLERSKDRLQHIDANLRKYNIKYQKFNAVDGRKLSMDEINNNVTKKCRYINCTKSHVGCAMSNIGLWKEISESSDKWHLILEDDIEFTDETIRILNLLENTSIIDDDDIIISLRCGKTFCKGPYVNLSSRKGGYDVNKLLIEPKRSLYSLYITYLGLTAYLLTKNTAKKLYDYFTKYKLNQAHDAQLSYNLPIIGIRYYALKDGIKLSSDNDNSTIMPQSKFLFMLNNFFNMIGLSRISRTLNTSFFVINLTTPINVFAILFIMILLLNIFLFKSILIYIYLLLEFIITLILINQ